MVATRTSTPLPTVPLELKHEILRFCDPSTLAQTARVSLAFLQLSSPLLYRNIAIVGLVGLQRLLVKRDSLAQPHLAPYLDIPSVATFNLEIIDYENAYETTLSLDRMPSSSGQISVDQLLLSSPPRARAHAQYSEVEALSALILPLFDPRHVKLVGGPSKTSTQTNPPLIDLVETPWPNLQTLTLLGRMSTYDFWGRSGFLKAGSEERRITVVVDLSGAHASAILPLGNFEGALDETVVDLSSDRGVNVLSSPRLKEMVVRVPAKKFEDLAREKIELSWNGREEGLKEEWRTRLRFEVC